MNVLRHGLRFVAAASIILAATAPAVAREESAQPDRWFLTVGGGLQSTSEPAPHGAAFEDPLFGSEAGEWTADYAGSRGEAFELSLGFRLASRWAVGASVSRLSLSEDVEVAGRIPHPFRFDRMSVVEGVGSGLSRDETTVHAHLMWFIPAGGKVEFLVGPIERETWGCVRRTQVPGLAENIEIEAGPVWIGVAWAGQQTVVTPDGLEVVPVNSLGADLDGSASARPRVTEVDTATGDKRWLAADPRIRAAGVCCGSSNRTTRKSW